MKITKQLNNNVIVASDSHGREVVLMGKGLGFKAKIGDKPNMALVEKQFFGPFSGLRIDELAELLGRIPWQHLGIGMQIVETVQKRLNKPLNETLVLLITDHISFAIERHSKGLDLDNALLPDIKMYYPDEYQLGLDALEIIEQEAGIRLRQDEAGFVAMHIVNAQYGEGEPVAHDLLAMIQDVIDIVQSDCEIVLAESTIDYARFITHLKYFFARIIRRKSYQNDDKLYKIVSVLYPDAAATAEKIDAYVQNKLNYSLSLEEQAYLIIHIAKLARREKF